MNKKTLTIFENIPEKKKKNFKAVAAVLAYSKHRMFFVGQPW